MIAPLRAFATALSLAALSSACAHATTPDAQGRICWTTLGTVGGPLPMAARAQPANLLSINEAHYFVDIGDGGFSALARAGVSPRAISGVFLSHLHFDHTAGLAALIGLRNAQRITTPLAIYGPPGTRELVGGIVASMQPAVAAGYGVPGEPVFAADANLSVIELTSGATVRVSKFDVTAIANTHYTFAPGSAEAARFVSLSYRFDAGGYSVAYTGDTGPSDAVVGLARGADVLVSEMIDLDAAAANIARAAPGIDPRQLTHATRHLETHHLTPGQVGALAQSAGVGRLVVTHLIPGNQSEAQLRDYLATIALQFDGPAVIANDGDRFCSPA